MMNMRCALCAVRCDSCTSSALGYHYNKDTKFADLSGGTCGGGYGEECVPVKAGWCKLKPNVDPWV